MTLATLGGLVLIGAFVLIVAGIAICSHFDSEYFDGDQDCHP